MRSSKAVVFVCGIIFMFAIGMLVGVTAQDEFWMRATVEKGYAIHCPKDGVWAWKGECKE